MATKPWHRLVEQVREKRRSERQMPLICHPIASLEHRVHPHTPLDSALTSTVSPSHLVSWSDLLSSETTPTPPSLHICISIYSMLCSSTCKSLCSEELAQGKLLAHHG